MEDIKKFKKILKELNNPDKLDKLNADLDNYLDDYNPDDDLDDASGEKVDNNPTINLDIIDDIKKNVGFSDKLSDLLDDKYQQWDICECIFINASTGLGKSYMIRECLYKHAQEKGFGVGIFVNRKALREQIRKDFKDRELQMGYEQTNVHLFTYQEIEQNGAKETLENCHYIVCDEAHYFIADALFNPCTQKSFDFITSLYEKKVLIFLSATLDSIRPFIEQRLLNLYTEKIEEVKKKVEINEYESLNDIVDLIEKKPKIKNYRFERNISDHLRVWYFNKKDDIHQAVMDKRYPGKWLIFVSSKKHGKILMNDLKKDTKKNIVYVDANYDSAYNNDEYRESITEMENIRKDERFNCDILISTSVLDCGINLTDPKLKNIVILSDNEDSFKQLLGRKRFLSEDEKINLFIWKGESRRFKDHSRKYSDLYLEIKEHKSFSMKDVYKWILYNIRNQNIRNILHIIRILSFYDFDSDKKEHECYPLTHEAIKLKFKYSYKVKEGLEKDDNFFLKEQLKWVGKEFTEEWLQSSNVYFDQNEVNEVTKYLNELYGSIHIIDKVGLEDLWQRLYPIAKKIDEKSYTNKNGSITTINNILRLRKEWEDFSIESIGDDTTNYEILREGKSKFVVKSDIDLEYLEKNVKGKSVDDFPSIFKDFFGIDMPDILKDPSEILNFVNAKLKDSSRLNDKILKRTKDTINISKRPQSKQS